MGIKLLAASVDIPPTSEVQAESTTLVIANRLSPATPSMARTASAYYEDAFVVSVAAGDNNSVQSPAVQVNNPASNWASTGWDKFLSAHIFGPGWIAATFRNAVAQYQSHASTSTQRNGHLLNVYA